MTISATVSDKQCGVLLVGHGTRSSIGIEQFLLLSRHVAQGLSPLPVEPAFLELSEPAIEVAVGRLMERGVRRLTIVPLLLFAAGHAKQDIPRAVSAAVRDCGLIPGESVEIRQAAHIGCHPAVVELSRLRLEQAIAQKSYVPAEDCCLILVGRGSHDASASAEMQHFCRFRHQSYERMPTKVAFLAMAQPLLSIRIAAVADSGARRVMVQPHLLFEGELVASVEEQVLAAQTRWPKQEWILTRPLADPVGESGCGMENLAKVIFDRYHEG